MNYKNLFSKKDQREHFQKEGNLYLRNPHASWVLLLKVFFVLLMVVFLLSLYKFYTTDKHAEDIQVGSTEEVKDAIQTQKLDAILDSFAEKEKKTDEIKQSLPVFVDPS